MKTKHLEFSSISDVVEKRHDTIGDQNSTSNNVPLPKPGSVQPVGYKNPPRESRFRKGQSGNPNGRPPKLKQSATEFRAVNFVDLISKELSRSHIRSGDGISSSEPTLLTLFQTQIRKAEDGDEKSFRIIFDTFQKFVAASEKEKQRLRAAAITYRTEKHLEIQALQKVGMSFAFIVPHPDHVFLDFEGNVCIIGPKTLDEKRKWDRLVIKREELHRHLRKITAELSRQPDRNLAAPLLAEKKRLLRRIEYIDSVIPEFYSAEHVRSIYSSAYRNRDDSVVELNLRNLNRDQREALALAIKAEEKKETREYYEVSPEALYNHNRSRK